MNWEGSTPTQSIGVRWCHSLEVLNIAWHVCVVCSVWYCSTFWQVLNTLTGGGVYDGNGRCQGMCRGSQGQGKWHTTAGSNSGVWSMALACGFSLNVFLFYLSAESEKAAYILKNIFLYIGAILLVGLILSIIFIFLKKVRGSKAKFSSMFWSWLWEFRV